MDPADARRVVGIDPGPKKGLHCFDGTGETPKPEQIPLSESRTYLQSLEKDASALVCWDAPLTGPPPLSTAFDGQGPKGSDLSQRPIEAFFSRNKNGLKVPKGISVMPYSGCPHWTISRALLGLPRMGPYDQADGLPFQLCTTNDPPSSGPLIVEVHPAVALWLWTKEEYESQNDISWQYKKEPETLAKLAKCLIAKLPEGSLREMLQAIIYNNLESTDENGKVIGGCTDDDLDCFIAYALGTIWLQDNSKVILLGDSDTGSFLVPNVDDIAKKWKVFRQRILKDK